MSRLPRLFIAALPLAVALAAADYSVEHSVIDQGGGARASADYRAVTSIGGLAGARTIDEVEVRYGFAGQLDEPPELLPDAVQRVAGYSTKLLVAAALANDFDFEGQSMTFAGVQPLSANGFPVETDGPWIFIGSTAVSLAADSVFYFVVDAFGATSIGEILVTTVPGENSHLTLLRIETEAGGVARVRFVGIPGRSYAIQATEELGSPNWQTIGNSTADGAGQYFFVDGDAGSFPARFYRAVRN